MASRSRAWRDGRIEGETCGRGGREASVVTCEEDGEGEDSASKRAWRTAESLEVRFGLEGAIVVIVTVL